MTINYLMVEGTATDEQDEGIPGVYEVHVDDEISNEDIGSAVLDIFHGDVPIEVIDDFEFTVFDENRIERNITETEPYTFIDRGTVYPSNLTAEDFKNSRKIR